MNATETDFPNVSFLSDTKTESSNITRLLEVASSDYLFCCEDVFTKIWENPS